MTSKVPAHQNTSKVNKEQEEEFDGDEEEEEEEKPSLQRQFVAYIRHKDENDPGTHILLSQSDFWMKQAGVIVGRTLTTTDTGICYSKFKKYKLNYEEYLEFLQLLADYKKIPVSEIINKLVLCGPPPDTTNLNKPVPPR